LNVRAAPAIFVNGRALVGAGAPNAIERAVDDALGVASIPPAPSPAFTRAFDVRANRRPLAVHLAAPIATDSSLELRVTLIDEDTGEVDDTTVRLSSYARRDWGEYWTDARPDATAWFAHVPSGRFAIRVEPVAHAGAAPTHVRISATSDELPIAPIALAGAALLALALLERILALTRKPAEVACPAS
jgi:hypothetical protein